VAGLFFYSLKALRRRNIRIRIRGRIVRIRVTRTCIRACIRITACQTNTKTAKGFKETACFARKDTHFIVF
jgi:hypothetical protein